jgi:hypothetical protein
MNHKPYIHWTIMNEKGHSYQFVRIKNW